MSFTPTLYDHVEVTVKGQPGASKKQLYWLAMCAAFGVARRFDKFNIVRPPFPGVKVFVNPPPGVIMMEYDASENWVRCVIDYEYSTADVYSGTRRKQAFDSELFQGPECEVKGGPFEWTGRGSVTGAGIPVSSLDTRYNVPVLPFDGKTIVTPCPQTRDPNPAIPLLPNPIGDPLDILAPVVDSPNPKPMGDHRSRGAVVSKPPATAEPPNFIGRDECCNISMKLIPLVYSSLTSPGTNAEEAFPTPTGGLFGR